MGSKKEIDDRFKKFGTVSFTGISKVNDFIGHLEQGKVMGTRCTDCGQVFFPPRAHCFKCLPGTIEWFAVEGSGKLITYSRLQFGPVGFEDDLPYCIALVDSQPGFGHTLLPQGREIDIVLDHHVPPENGCENPVVFQDVRIEVGATSSMVTGYMMELGTPLTADVATGLLYGDTR